MPAGRGDAVGYRSRKRSTESAAWSTGFRFSSSSPERGVALVIVQPTDNAALALPLKAANRAGVPVVAFDQYILGGTLAAYLTSDNRQAGQQDGEYVAHLFPDDRELKLVVVEYPHVSSTVERLDGFLDALAKNGQPFRIHGTYLGVDPQSGARAAAAILADFPTPGSIDVVFTVNDGGGLAVVDALAAAGRHEVVVRASGLFYERFGLEPDGRPRIADLMPVPPLSNAPDSSAGTEVQVEVGGEARVLFASHFPVATTREGEVLLTCVMAADLTAMYRAATERRALEDQLRESQKMEAIGRLAGGIAHDFNNLLTVIAGRAEMLRLSLEPGTPGAREMDTIYDSAMRAAELTRKLLAISRRQVLRSQAVYLDEVVEGMMPILERVIGEDVRLTRIGQPDLWPVRGDPGQIEQVLMNLVVNARDAMPEGGRVSIEVANRSLTALDVAHRPDIAPGDYVMLAVSDTGAGIPLEIQDRVFEPFFTTKAVGLGTGLGLATVRGIVQQSGGHIWLTSEPDLGTTFRICLPRLVDPTKVPDNPGEVPGEPPPGGTEVILVVEDDAAVRTTVASILVSSGYTVLEADNGVTALELLDKLSPPPDLVLSDLIMPEMKGPELARRLRDRFPDLKVLFMTGYSEDVVEARLDVGEHGYVQKPPTLVALRGAVRRVLDA